jgi:hypothetical protein
MPPIDFNTALLYIVIALVGWLLRHFGVGAALLPVAASVVKQVTTKVQPVAATSPTAALEAKLARLEQLVMGMLTKKVQPVEHPDTQPGVTLAAVPTDAGKTVTMHLPVTVQAQVTGVEHPKP